MSLIKQAMLLPPGRFHEMELPTDDELGLFVAYLNQEVTAKQCFVALGRSRGYFYNWTRRCLWRLYQEGRIKLNWNDRTVTFRRQTYEERQRVERREPVMA